MTATLLVYRLLSEYGCYKILIPKALYLPSVYRFRQGTAVFSVLSKAICTINTTSGH